MAVETLCTVEDVVAMLKLTDKKADPGEVQRVIQAASDAIRTYTKRPFGIEATGDRYFSGVSEAGILAIDDAIEITDVADEGFGLPLVYAAMPQGAPAEAKPYTALHLSYVRESDGVLTTYYRPDAIVFVSGTWGWPVVPDDVRHAAIQQASSWYTLDSSRVADSWADEFKGGTRQSGQMLPRGLLYGVRDTIRPYRKVSMA